MNTAPSIFNNVLGPVMRGPSSSHTAAAVRIGLLARRLLGEEPVMAEFTFDRRGSLATTYRGQGSAMGLAAGLLGMDIKDRDLVKAEEKAAAAGLVIKYRIEDYGAGHPNTYRTLLRSATGKELRLTALSTGGGIIRLTELDGKVITDDLDYVNPLMPLPLKNDAVLPFTGLAELEELIGRKGGPLSSYAVDYEAALGDVTATKIKTMARSHLNIMKDAISAGLAGTEYADRLLHRQSHLMSLLPPVGRLIPSDLTNSIIQSVTAVMEVKSAMGLIIAAPTAGSCGTIPGVLMPAAKAAGSKEEDMTLALLAAGLTGVFIARKGGFAAEEGGCQYECGSASAMAAAALVELMGGHASMSLNAASMALQNTLGMICDPVADRVEVPCLGKNIMAALNALAAANMTIAGYRHVIPLEEVIEAMQEVGSGMDHKYRCTCKGGLSVTPTALRIHKDLGE